MAEEERRDDRPSRRGERPEGEQQQASAPISPKKKRKRSRVSFLFLLLLLAFGVGTGLHFSGFWDARPLMWQIVPKIPGLGQPVSRFFGIPEQYTLSVAERRAFELAGWQRRLDARERDLALRESDAEAVSGDLVRREERLARQETAERQPTSREESAASGGEKKLIDQVARTYQDMSPRNAAQVVEQLTEGLAVELLQKLPVDARASILGKMDPGKAARLTELMAGTPR
jgi:hypothetical protein